MRAPLLSFVLVITVVVATVSLVPAVCNGEAAATPGEEHGGSIKPLSLDGYEAQDKPAKKPKQPILDVQGTPKMTADTSGQMPIQEQAAKATASSANQQADQFVASTPVPGKKEKEKSDESVADESARTKLEKKVKKLKKDISDYLDESTSSKKKKKHKSEDSESDELVDESVHTKKEKKVKKVKSDDSDSKTEKNENTEYLDVSATSKKKKKKAKTDEDSVEDATVTKKHKKHKKEKSDDDSDSASPKKEKEKSVDSDEATAIKKQKKHKKHKKKEENSEEEKPDSDATPVDVSTTTGQYVASSNADAKLINNAGERQISTNPADAYVAPKQDASSQPMASPDEPLPAAKSAATPDAYASPKQQVVSSQPMAAGSPDEPLPAAKSSATPDAYASPKQQVVSSQPMAGGSPDELPPAAKKPAAFDQFASSKHQVFNMLKQPIAKMLSPVIKSVCAKATYPEDCEQSISGLHGAASAAATDPVGVLKLAMQAVREKVVVALNAAAERMKGPNVDAATKDALSSCEASYSDIKSALDTVNDALKRGDVDTAKTNLDAVETDLTTCDDGFQEHGTPSVMTDHDQELQKLASNLLSIGSIIKPE